MPWTQLGKLIARIRDLSAWTDQQEEERDERDRAQRGFQLYGLGDTNAASSPDLTSALLASPFAEEWYRMRELGEHDRAEALSALYTQRRQPGGSHPDPRAPAAFSNRAIIAASARLKGFKIWAVPPDTGSHNDPRTGAQKPAQTPVWLITYPLARSGARRMPHIAVTHQDEEEL